MADKLLTAKDWQRFAAGRGYKDAALVKALSAAEKADDDPPALLKALDTLEVAARELQRQHKADKALDAHLADLHKALRTRRQEAERAAAEAASADDDEDTRGGALLDPRRLLQQLTLCRKDHTRRVSFAFVDAHDKVPAVLVMHPRMAGRRLFALLCEATGLKTGAHGTAWMEGTELMLLPDKAVGGLAKKLRQPVKDCGFRVTRIVLWNADGTAFEADETPEAAAAESAGTAAPATAAATSGPVPPAPPRPASAGAAPGAAPATRAPSADELAFTARLKAMLPRIAALGEAPEARAARLLASEAGTRLRKGDAAGANAQLDQAEQLLQRARPSAPGAAETTSAPVAAAAAPRVAPGVRYTQTRLAWDRTRKHVQAELRRLEQAILAETATHPEGAVIASNTRVLYTVLDHLDERLIDVLDDALNAPDDALRREHQATALGLVDEYLAYVNGGDPFLAVVDDNGFVPVDIVPMLRQRLGEMRRVLDVAVQPG